MKKLFLMLLTLASTNLLFGVRPHEERTQPRTGFTVQRADQTAQNNTPAQHNQGNATRPLDRRATTEPHMAQFLNDFQITTFPRTLPAPQDNNNTLLNRRPAVAMTFDDSQSDDDLLSSDSDDDISSISGTENRDNNNRGRIAQTPAPMARFINDFQLQGQRTNAPLQTQTMGIQTDDLVRELLQARTTNGVRALLRNRRATFFAQVRRNHNQ